MDEKTECLWCNELITLIDGAYNGSYGTVIEKRCPKCHGLVSTRLQGIPQDIIRKNTGAKA